MFVGSGGTRRDIMLCFARSLFWFKYLRQSIHLFMGIVVPQM